MASFISHFNEFSVGYSQWLWHSAWQGSVVGISIILFVKYAPKIPLSMRYALLIVAMIKFVVPPIFALPSGLFSIVNVDSISLSQVDQNLSPVGSEPDSIQDFSREFTLQIPAPASKEIQEIWLESNQFPASPPTATKDIAVKIPAVPTDHQDNEIESTSQLPSGQIGFPSLILLIHLIGASVFAFWIIFQSFKLWRLTQRSHPFSLSDLTFEHPSLATLPPLLNGIRLRHSSAINSPIAFGLYCPTILLPSNLLESDGRQIQTILLHEMAHIRRRDILAIWMEVVITTVWWFHPVVWMLRRSLSSIREDCCDDDSISTGTTSDHEYCQTLLQIAQTTTTSSGRGIACGINDGHPLGRRISRLMNPNRIKAKKLGLVGMIVTGLCAILILPGLNTSSNTLAQQVNDQTQRTELDNRSDVETQDNTVIQLQTGFGELELHQITIRGTAVNEAGSPISDATILVGSAKSRIMGRDGSGKEYVFQGELARVTTDPNGRFEFTRLTVPVQSPPEDYPNQEPMNAKLQLIGIASNMGLTWSRTFQFRPGEKYAVNLDEGPVFFKQDQIEFELIFPAQIPLHGRVTDEQGNPISDVMVRFGKFLDGRDPWDVPPKMTLFNFIEGSPNAGKGDLQVNIVPQDVLSSQTDQNGTYQLNHVPVGVRFGLSFSHEKFPSHVVKVVETNMNPQATVNSGNLNLNLGEDGVLDLQMQTVRHLQFRALTPNDDIPLPRARFEITQGDQQKIINRTAVTADETGSAVLRLLPGEYEVKIMPPSNQPFWSVHQKLMIEEDSFNDSFDFQLQDARRVNLEAIFEDQSAIPGVSFDYTTDDATGTDVDWHRVRSQGATTEFPVTGATGILSALLPFDATAVRVTPAPLSGELNPILGQLIDNRPNRLDSQQNSSVPVIKFEFKKTEAGKTRDLIPRYDESLNQAISRGRFRYRRNSILKKNVSQVDFVSFVNSLDSPDASSTLEELKNYFGELPMSDSILVQDRKRRKSTTFIQSEGVTSTNVMLSDGENIYRYFRIDQQCSVWSLKNSLIGFPSIQSLMVHPMKLISLPQRSVVRTVEPDSIIYRSSPESGNDDTRGQIQLIEKRTLDDQYIFFRSNASPTHAKISWQFFPQEVNGGLIPTIVVQARFQNQQLERAEIVVFDEVELFETLNGDTFAMSVPAGTNVVDYRGSDRGEVGRRSRNIMLRTSTFDLASRLGQPIQREPHIRYGDIVPPISADVWIEKGAIIPRPAFNDKIQLIYFCDLHASRLNEDIADLRRAIERFSEDDQVSIIALFRNGTTATEMIQFAVERELQCYLASDSSNDASVIAGKGKTQTALNIRTFPVSVVLDQSSKISYYGFHSGQVDGAAMNVEKLRQ